MVSEQERQEDDVEGRGGLGASNSSIDRPGGGDDGIASSNSEDSNRGAVGGEAADPGAITNAADDEDALASFARRLRCLFIIVTVRLISISISH